MPKVTFLPIQKTYDAKVGESVLDVALNFDVPLQHACGGFCACTTCHIKVVEGAENLQKMDDEENERIQGVDSFEPARSRLGCQAKITGDVTVEIMNLDL